MKVPFVEYSGDFLFSEEELIIGGSVVRAFKKYRLTPESSNRRLT